MTTPVKERLETRALRDVGLCGHITSAEPHDVACLRPIGHDGGEHELPGRQLGERRTPEPLPDCSYFGGNGDPRKCNSSRCPRHGQQRSGHAEVEAWKGTAEDGSVGFDLLHGGRSLGAVTFAADGDVEIVIRKHEKSPQEPREGRPESTDAGNGIGSRGGAGQPGASEVGDGARHRVDAPSPAPFPRPTQATVAAPETSGALERGEISAMPARGPEEGAGTLLTFDAGGIDPVERNPPWTQPLAHRTTKAEVTSKTPLRQCPHCLEYCGCPRIPDDGLRAEIDRIEAKARKLIKHVPLPAHVVLTNGGQRCDMAVGPCACGAWHDSGETLKRVFEASSCTDYPVSGPDMALYIAAEAMAIYGFIGGWRCRICMVATEGDENNAGYAPKPFPHHSSCVLHHDPRSETARPFKKGDVIAFLQRVRFRLDEVVGSRARMTMLVDDHGAEGEWEQVGGPHSLVDAIVVSETGIQSNDRADAEAVVPE